MLPMSEKNVDIKTVLIVIQNFGDFQTLYLWYVEGDYYKPVILNSKFHCHIWYRLMKVCMLSGI